MKNKILYYPYINIPKEQWIYKSVLYWDEVGAIIPPTYGEEENLTNHFTKELIENGLLTQVFPEEYIQQKKDFSDFFLNLIEQPQFNIDLKRKAFELGSVSRIHINKFYHPFMDELINRKIATRENWSSWYHVEAHTSNLLMTYLANVISKIGDYSLSTDELKNFKINIHKNINDEKILSIRENVINDVLPFPINADLGKLRKFKESNFEDLQKFRLSIERLILELAVIEDKEIYEKKYNLEIDAINHEKERLLALMDESKIGKMAYSSMGGLITAGLAFYVTNDPTLALGPLWVGVSAAVNEYEKSEVQNHELAYLALINKKFKNEIR
jgi:hypothetical protein